MRIKSHPRYLSLIVMADDDSDRALLGQFLKAFYARDKSCRLIIQGATYACDFSAHTDFCFGWVDANWGTPKSPAYVPGEGWAEELFND